MTQLLDATATLRVVKKMQENGIDVYCPRCGKQHTESSRALSRVVNVNICNHCGTQESLDEYFGGGISIRDWWIVKPTNRQAE